MPEYRRVRQPGGTYFFTVNLQNRRSDLLVRRIDDLWHAFDLVQRKRPFVTEAFVILPEHLHAIWTLPTGDHDFTTRWRRIKETFTLAVPAGEYRSPSRVKRGERGLWQRRFHEHLIRDEADFTDHVNYVHYNPVKHGHVKRPLDWPHASIHDYIERGIIDAAWGASGLDRDMDLE